MHRFDYSELKGNVPADILGLVKDISIMQAKGEVRADAYQKHFDMIQNMAMAASARFSNEIEGIVTSDERIMDIVLRGGVPETHDEREIAGYRDALSLIHSEHDRIGFNSNTLLLMHRHITRYSRKETGFKKHDNAIVSVDSNGNRSLIFRPTPASDVEFALEQMFLAYDDAAGDTEPLLLIPAVISDLLCIHPFSDGNGRVSRLMTTLLLYRAGYDVPSYVSLDEHIFGTRSGYYRSLAEVSNGWHENESSYFPFIRYFLMMLYECYIDLDTRFALVNNKGVKKEVRIESILMNSLSPISKRQLHHILPDISVRTIESVISRLLSEGRIEKVGTFKDARYRVRL